MEMLQKKTTAARVDNLQATTGLWSSTRTELLPVATLPQSLESCAVPSKQQDPTKNLNLNAIIDQLASEHELMYQVALSKWHPDDAQ